MNDEEKKVIKMLDKFTTEHKFYNIKHSDNLEDNIEIVLKLIEKLQKENVELKEENEYNKILLDMNNNFTIDKKTGNYKWNVIEIQKVKDKIEELNSRIEIYTKYVEQGVETDVEWVDNVADRETVKVLQELIEEREVKEKWINIKQLKD